MAFRDIDISSRRVGPAVPALTGTGKRHPPVAHLPSSTCSQSMNQMGCERLHHRHLIDSNNPGSFGQDPLSDCKATIHVTCERRPRVLRPNLPSDQGGFDLPLNASLPTKGWVYTYRAAGLQHEIFTRRSRPCCTTAGSPPCATLLVALGDGALRRPFWRANKSDAS